MIIPRDYQAECFDDVIKLWQNGHKGVLVHLATGLGKTVLMAMLHDWYRKRGERILVLAHLWELLDNASQKFKEFNDSDMHFYEKGMEHFVPSSAIRSGSANIVFGMVQSLHKEKRLHKYPADYFQKIFIDETHRGVAETYLKVQKWFPDAQVLGVTATPKRADKVSLGAIFDAVSERSMSVTEGIGMGWLVPFRPTCYKVKSLDFSGMDPGKGDFKEEEIEQALMANGTKPLHEIAAGLKDMAPNLQTIVFLSGVDAARRLAKIMREDYNEPVDFICGTTEYDVRKNILDRYRQGEIQRIINVGVLTEGVDLPNTQCVAIARITRSESRYLQMAGRGTRPWPGGLVDLYKTPQDRVNAIAASNKPECLLLDFKGNMGRHQFYVDGKELLSGLMPHRNYGIQPKPSKEDVIRVGNREGNESKTIEELRQEASDELFVNELIEKDEYSIHAAVKKAEVHEYKDLFGMPKMPLRKVEKDAKPPLPKNIVAFPEQRQKIIWLHERLGLPPPTTNNLLRTSRKKARVVIGKLLQRLQSR